MKKKIKKLTAIFILSVIINSCGKQNSCEIPSKSIDSLSMNLDTLSSTPEKLEINGKTIESKFIVSDIPDIQAIPSFLKHCERIFTVRLVDSKTKEGLFKEYSFEYYWYFSKESKQSVENSIIEYDPDNTKVRLVNVGYVQGLDSILIIKIKNKTTNESYLLKSIGS